MSDPVPTGEAVNPQPSRPPEEQRDEPGTPTERRIAEIKKRLSEATPYVLFLSPVEGEEFAACFQGEHWDICRQVGETTDVITEPGFSSMTVNYKMVNVGCWSGSQEDARLFIHAHGDISWLLAQLRAALSSRGEAPGIAPSSNDNVSASAPERGRRTDNGDAGSTPAGAKSSAPPQGDAGPHISEDRLRGIDEQDGDIPCPPAIRDLVYEYGREAMRFGFFGEQIGYAAAKRARRALLTALARARSSGEEEASGDTRPEEGPMVEAELAALTYFANAWQCSRCGARSVFHNAVKHRGDCTASSRTQWFIDETRKSAPPSPSSPESDKP